MEKSPDTNEKLNKIIKIILLVLGVGVLGVGIVILVVGGCLFLLLKH